MRAIYHTHDILLMKRLAVQVKMKICVFKCGLNASIGSVINYWPYTTHVSKYKPIYTNYISQDEYQTRHEKTTSCAAN